MEFRNGFLDRAADKVKNLYKKNASRAEGRKNALAGLGSKQNPATD